MGGAEQSGLPDEYVDYLRGLPAYQRPVLGWLHELLAIRAFLAFWIPILTFVMNRAKPARAPSSSSSPIWTAAVVNVLFRSMWLYHDAIHRRKAACQDRGLGARKMGDVSPCVGRRPHCIDRGGHK